MATSAPVRRLRRTLALTATIAVVVTICLPILETSTAPAGATVPHVMSAGWPRDWITQQSTLSPPSSYTYRVASPLENATTIDRAALAFNVLVVWTTLCVLMAVRASWTTSRQRRPKPRLTQVQAGRR